LDKLLLILKRSDKGEFIKVLDRDSIRKLIKKRSREECFGLEDRAPEVLGARK